MSLDEMKAELAGVESQLKRLDAHRRTLRQAIAEAQAKFKVGDRVTFEGARYSWEICQIVPGYDCSPKYHGAKLKKDGTPSLSRGEIHVAYGKSLRLL